VCVWSCKLVSVLVCVKVLIVALTSGIKSLVRAIIMATYNNGQFPANLPILDGKNYDSWSKQMKVLFNYQDVMDQVTNGVDSLTEGATENQRTQHKELKKKDFKALFIIHQSVPFFTTTHIFFSCHHEHNRYT
ncbi:hypothetical protein L195_g032220, partial [Trifolium pratense]